MKRLFIGLLLMFLYIGNTSAGESSFDRGGYTNFEEVYKYLNNKYIEKYKLCSKNVGLPGKARSQLSGINIIGNVCSGGGGSVYIANELPFFTYSSGYRYIAISGNGEFLPIYEGKEMIDIPSDKSGVYYFIGKVKGNYKKDTYDFDIQADRKAFVLDNSGFTKGGPLDFDGKNITYTHSSIDRVIDNGNPLEFNKYKNEFKIKGNFDIQGGFSLEKCFYHKNTNALLRYENIFKSDILEENINGDFLALGNSKYSKYQKDCKYYSSVPGGYVKRLEPFKTKLELSIIDDGYSMTINEYEVLEKVDNSEELLELGKKIIKEKAEKIKQQIYNKYGEIEFKNKIGSLYKKNPEKVLRIKRSIEKKMDKVVENDKLNQNQKINEIAKNYAILMIFSESINTADMEIELEKLLDFKLF